MLHPAGPVPYTYNVPRTFTLHLQDSPVWENTEYVSHLYEDLFKKQYLPTAGIAQLRST